MKNDPTVWLLARTGGVAAYVFLAAAVAFGTVVKARPFGKLVKPAAATDLHRFLALLGLASLALHGAALALDTVVPISPLGLVVPGLVSYRPLWTGAGVVAGELMLVVYVSFSARRLIGMRAWRLLHWTTYPLFALATLHGIMAGTDSARPWARDLYVGALAAAVAAACFRVLGSPVAGRRRRAEASAGTSG